jgi:hydrogenase expression/formation protein HypC
MCLAVPGKILSIEGDDPFLRTGRVDFAGIVKTINLAYVPEAKIGDYVLVHVGFALNTIDEAEANQTFEYLRQMGELADLEETDDSTAAAPPRPPGPAPA